MPKEVIQNKIAQIAAWLENGDITVTELMELVEIWQTESEG